MSFYKHRYTIDRPKLVEKAKVLREVLEGVKAGSEVSEKYELHPNNIFKWRKQLLEEGKKAFIIKRSDITRKVEESRVPVFEEKIR